MIEQQQLWMVYVQTKSAIANFLVAADDLDEALAAASQVAADDPKYYGLIVKIELYSTPLLRPYNRPGFEDIESEYPD